MLSLLLEASDNMAGMADKWNQFVAMDWLRTLFMPASLPHCASWCTTTGMIISGIIAGVFIAFIIACIIREELRAKFIEGWRSLWGMMAFVAPLRWAFFLRVIGYITLYSVLRSIAARFYISEMLPGAIAFDALSAFVYFMGVASILRLIIVAHGRTTSSPARTALSVWPLVIITTILCYRSVCPCSGHLLCAVAMAWIAIPVALRMLDTQASYMTIIRASWTFICQYAANLFGISLHVKWRVFLIMLPVTLSMIIFGAVFAVSIGSTGPSSILKAASVAGILLGITGLIYIILSIPRLIDLQISRLRYLIVLAEEQARMVR